MVSFVLVSAILIAYFIYMTTEDVKTRTVPVFPSNLLMGVFFAAYLSYCFLYRASVDVIGLMVSFAFLVFFVKKRSFIGSADAKALFICYLASPFLSVNKGELFSWSNLNAFTPGVIYCLSAIPFVAYCIVRGVRNHLPAKEIFFGKKERTAFFPFLTAGFLSFLVFQIYPLY